MNACGTRCAALQRGGPGARANGLVVAVALALALVGCDAPQGPPQSAAAPNVGTPGSAAPIPADAPLVVVFGDSLYAGYGLGRDEGFAPQLERALAAAGHPAQVQSAGVSGDTTAAGLARLAFTLDGLPSKPDLVLVGLGGNDMLRGLSPEQTRSNLVGILDELKRRGIPAMLTGMLAAPNLGADYVGEFNAIYPDLARTYGVPLDPFFLKDAIDVPGRMLPDGVHPNASGVAAMTRRVAPLVASQLPDPAAGD